MYSLSNEYIYLVDYVHKNYYCLNPKEIIIGSKP